MNRRIGDEKAERKKEGRINEVKKMRDKRQCVLVCNGGWGGKKQEERTVEELLMALLLSLSACCDSQNQLLTKTTSFLRKGRRTCNREDVGARGIRAEEESRGVDVKTGG